VVARVLPAANNFILSVLSELSENPIGTDSVLGIKTKISVAPGTAES